MAHRLRRPRFQDPIGFLRQPVVMRRITLLQKNISFPHEQRMFLSRYQFPCSSSCPRRWNSYLQSMPASTNTGNVGGYHTDPIAVDEFSTENRKRDVSVAWLQLFTSLRHCTHRIRRIPCDAFLRKDISSLLLDLHFNSIFLVAAAFFKPRQKR